MLEALESAHAYSARSLSAPLDDEVLTGEGLFSEPLVGVDEGGYDQVRGSRRVLDAGLDALDVRGSAGSWSCASSLD